MRPSPLLVSTVSALLLGAPHLAAAHKSKPGGQPEPQIVARSKHGKKPAKPAPADAPVTPATATAAPVAAPSTPAGTAKPTAAEAVARMQKFYEATTDLHARFDQELQGALGGVKKAAGDVWLKKPGRMRWEYTRPEKKLMVADGTTLWVYEAEDQQAFRQGLKTSSLPSSVTFLFGTGKLTDEFIVTEERPPATPGATPGPGAAIDASDLVLKLEPKKATTQYHHLYFVVDPATFGVKETLVYDQQGGWNRIRFSSVETNKGTANSRFDFTPPEGTRIIKP
jgi:outer membrane lipoprotein carrier protein